MSDSTLSSLAQRVFGLTQGEGLRARLIRGGLGSAAIQAANRMLALALGIVLARNLGTAGYGTYAYAFAIMSLLMVLAEAGMPTLLMREIAASQGREDWGLLRGVLRRAGQFVTLTATTVSLIGLFILGWFADSLHPEVFYTSMLMLLLLPLSALCKTVAHAMYGLHRVVIGRAVDMLIRPLLVVLIVAGVFIFWPEQRQPHIAMAAQLFGALAALIVGTLVLRRFLPSETRTAVPKYRNRQWLKSALPFTLIGGAGVINNQADIIMLGWFSEPGEVGVYRVAVQGATLMAFSWQVVNPVVAPQFSGLYAKGDMLRLQHLVTRSARIILLAALPVALAFGLAGKLIILRVFGAEFGAAYGPLAVLIVGQLVLAAFGISGPLLSMVGFESKISKAMWISTLANIILNVLLIPTFGMFGAAVATAFTISGWHAYLVWLSRGHLGILVSPFRGAR